MPLLISTTRLQLYTWQLFNALGYIHALGVTHLDVKPENILCDPIMHVIKLADFDSARRLSPQHGIGNRVYCVTRYYRPPELVFNGTVHTVNIGKWKLMGC
jgi:glycogen synthase kinase 3 beta